MRSRNPYRLKVKPYSDAEIDKLKLQYDQEIMRYGRSYGDEYGWASSVLAGKDKKRVKFVDIEGSVNLDHWRPYFKMACNNVHAGPKGILFRLGEYPKRNVLLAGPSDRGLEEPIQGAAISLMQTTVCLLTTMPNIDRLVLCNVMMHTVDEILHYCKGAE